MISPGKSSIGISDVLEVVSEFNIAYHYLNLNSIPCIINSPLRQDRTPSFGIYSPNGKEINYIDFATGERGRLFTLLTKLWHCDMESVYKRILKECPKNKNEHKTLNITYGRRTGKVSKTEMECRVREWRDYDIEYWASYGISLKWLKYADVYPISHKIIIKDGKRMVFGADKYAYAYAEFKEGKTTLKIYQPFNKKGYKWSNKHDRSVISLWTKVPKEGDMICICSSLKDALCLWANTGIPSLAIQGEGYAMSDTAIQELKRRYKRQYILLDNDKAGLKDAERLSETTGFTNIVLPKINNAKDISDLYQSLENKLQFKQIITNLFKDKENGS